MDSGELIKNIPPGGDVDRRLLDRAAAGIPIDREVTLDFIAAEVAAIKSMLAHLTAGSIPAAPPREAATPSQPSADYISWLADEISRGNREALHTHNRRVRAGQNPTIHIVEDSQ